MIDFSKIKTTSIHQREHKVFVKDFPSLEDRIKNLRNKDIDEIASTIKAARKNNIEVLVMIGGHVVKTGMGVYLIDLLNRGFITHLAANGAAAIHDFEIAMVGETSEDVAK